MKAEKNPVDQFAEFAGAVVRQLPRDLAPAQMQRYIQDQDALNKALRSGLVRSGILERLIAQSGITDVDSNITSVNFGVTEEPDDRELMLAHPNQVMTTKGVKGYISEHGQQPETPEQLVRHAIKNPEAGLAFPIVALGRFWVSPDGDRGCVVLGGYEGGRCLDLLWADDGGRGWGGSCRFLVSAVSRKQ